MTKHHKPPFIVGVDMAREPDRSAVMSWDGCARVIHELPAGASVTLHGQRILVVHPGGPPYEVDMMTGATTPVDLLAKWRAPQDSNLRPSD